MAMFKSPVQSVVLQTALLAGKTMPSQDRDILATTWLNNANASTTYIILPTSDDRLNHGDVFSISSPIENEIKNVNISVFRFSYQNRTHEPEIKHSRSRNPKKEIHHNILLKITLRMKGISTYGWEDTVSDDVNLTVNPLITATTPTSLRTRGIPDLCRFVVLTVSPAHTMRCFSQG